MKHPSKQKRCGHNSPLLLHADISYRKPIRAQSGKIPNHVLSLHVITHKRVEKGKERHNKKRKTHKR
jgi:hypothetical protein